MSDVPPNPVFSDIFKSIASVLSKPETHGINKHQLSVSDVPPNRVFSDIFKSIASVLSKPETHGIKNISYLCQMYLQILYLVISLNL